MAYCDNCGNELLESSKFCPECGQTVKAKESERKISYEGEIHKCPSCGEVLSAFAVNCPSCGYEIRGGKASSSAREFAARLVDTANDEQKVTLIQSFPIPNNKEDILEFMIVASTNFDASANMSGTGMKKTVSDAWLAKVEQSYQKATLLFANDSDFSKIQTVYEQVTGKIKNSAAAVKKKNIVQTVLGTIGLWGGLIVFLIALIIDIIATSANTSILHLSGALILIIGACIVGRRKEMVDVVIGAFACVLTILLGMLLQGVFDENGSLMVVGGGIALVIVIVQLFRSVGKK